MPTRWTLRLHSDPTPRYATPQQLHGLACALFEGAGADHTGQSKSFTTSPLLAGGQPSARFAELCLGWLDDTRVPAVEALTGRNIRLGAQLLTVHDVRREAAPYQALLAAPADSNRIEMTFVTPTHFNRSDRYIPLPDPELVYQSLLRRWNRFAPEPIAESLAEELISAVVLAEHDVASCSVDLGPGRRIGFTGRSVFTLLNRAGDQAHRIFTALSRFASVAGVGAQTTHGQGYVRITPARTRTPGRGPVTHA
ncbi:CRISPR system precrRNA processing endoribonuclease RAMP protein Cas6 [Streptomyces cellulosae]|jgi:CRISPR-associated endoribonuclease Cas6|uniref:CRISPR system precrRNA processing endoribonuclease RAMP protein Cas6 n=1 Tax=Streptomyces TaxID=1883 RepID=UPI0020C61F35|nr:CRISPR system precrRNA processing endoribonuclease RAMP protein Cas6 [Streptomyces sp. AC04842]WTB80840.1 CRISPR system precrRNA processing endoribonuclease RAMP protein Cas6 [Streptomyces cellulosae]